MATRIEELQYTSSWVGALQSDPDRFGRLACDANKNIVRGWLTENG